MYQLPSGKEAGSTIESLRAKLQQCDERSQEERSKDGLPDEVIRELLAHFEIDLPVRFEHAIVTDDIDEHSPVEKIGSDIWIIPIFEKSKRSGKSTSRGNCKVERVEERGKTRWECGCPGWLKQRGTDCRHILKIKHDEGIDTTPYSTVRRRPRTKWLYPIGQPVQSTREAKARAEFPTLVPQMLAELCRFSVVQPVRVPKTHGKSGAIGMPLAVAAYCLLLKIFNNWNYDQLRAALDADIETIQRLGWKKSNPPCIRALVTAMVKPGLVEAVAAMLPLTAMPGRLFESIVMVDSDDLPTVQVANSRDRKFGVEPPSYRKPREMVRRHFAMGAVLGLIPAADVTLSIGAGSADAAHLPGLAARTKAVYPNFEFVPADRAYGSKRNYLECEEIGVDLLVRAKQNEERENPRNGWSESAVRLARLEREHRGEFHEKYRYRSKGEGVPSRLKGANPRARLRRRVADPVVCYPPEAADVMADQGSPKNIREEREANRTQRNRMSELPTPVIEAILEAATKAVGPARLAEAWATMVIANVKRLVALEHLCGGSSPARVNLEFASTLPLIPTVRESELRERLAAELDAIA
jgi:hypothetical protein